MTAVPERLASLGTLVLTHGDHASFDAGVCAMEAVAWLAGEKHSDTPQCACPVLTRYATRLNDAYWPTNEARTVALRAVLPLLIGTRSTREVELRRAYFLADRAVREFAPMALDARRPELASRLRALPAIVDHETAKAALAEAREVRKAAAADAAAAAAAAAAAYAYAAAAADAAAYAAAAAAAAAAAYAAAARLRILRRAAEVLGEACAIKEMAK